MTDAADPQPIQERLGFAPARLQPRAGSPPATELAAAARAIVDGLPLRRALAFLDLEATGVDPLSDRVVELFVARVEPDGTVRALATLVDPGQEIPAAAAAVHGIDARQVVGAPTFAEIAPDLLRVLRGADLAGYNLVRYDLPLLRAELARAGHPGSLPETGVVDACALFKRMERRDLASAVRFYCGETQSAAHTAGGDTIDTMRVLAGQLRRYPQLPREVSELDRLLRPPAERR